ncbi:MAG: UDP-N-acetylmuramate dehydrogenase [Moraxellaceae bacterium]|nr:UDP-N-acetylmuramate dehydrogenase [Moraxellaceae bacterium]
MEFEKNEIRILIMKILHNFDLSKNNTMALSATAKQAVILDDEAMIEPLFANLDKDTKLLILSGGSNIILPSEVNALVIMPRFQGIEIIKEDKNQVLIEVMAGNNWHELVVETVNKGWYGLENLALIAGLVGASPVQNIGAYGVQLEDCLEYVKAFHIPTQTWQILTKDDCKFAYRDSIFKQNPNTWLISRVALRLHKDATKINMNYGDVKQQAQQYAEKNKREIPTPVDVMNAVISIRQSKLPDPKELANTGSFFQNPIIQRSQYEELSKTYPNLPKYEIDEEMVKVPAGWLIEQAGLKGDGVAPILTHKKQALVLTNHAPYQATQVDIAKTCELIINTVQEKFAIKLQAEPVWID